MSVIMQRLPITGPGGRSTAMESIIPPLVKNNPVTADLSINCLRLVLLSMCIRTGAQSRAITNTEIAKLLSTIVVPSKS